MSLLLSDLHVSIEGKLIVKGLTLEIKPGEIHAIMGPNGSGKSTLANALMGHPKYTITAGTVRLNGTDITQEGVDKRAVAGLFLSQQYSPEIPGVTLANFLRLATVKRRNETINPLLFHRELLEKMKELLIDTDFAKRYLNTGFSGGEKKKAEILQLVMLNPTYAILDETDSGLDVDALKIVAAGINRFHQPTNGVLLITHYNRILQYVVPHYVHIMMDGKIVLSGGKELAQEVEKHGYTNL